MRHLQKLFFVIAVFVAIVLLAAAISLSEYQTDGYTAWEDAPDALQQLIAAKEDIPVSDVIIREKTVLDDRIFLCWEDRSLSAVRMTWFETTEALLARTYIRIGGSSRSSDPFNVYRLTGNFDGTGDQSLFVIYGDNRQTQAAQYSFEYTPAKPFGSHRSYQPTPDGEIHVHHESLNGDFLLKVVLLPGIYQCSAVDLLNDSGDLLLIFS